MRVVILAGVGCIKGMCNPCQEIDSSGVREFLFWVESEFRDIRYHTSSQPTFWLVKSSKLKIETLWTSISRIFLNCPEWMVAGHPEYLAFYEAVMISNLRQSGTRMEIMNGWLCPRPGDQTTSCAESPHLHLDVAHCDCYRGKHKINRWILENFCMT